MELRITDIEWDTDGQDAGLPSELAINAEAEGIDLDDVSSGVADWLSDKYGWLVKSFSVEAGPTPGAAA